MRATMLFVAVLALAPATAAAQDYSNSLGLGAESSLALSNGPLIDTSLLRNRLPGLSIRYRITRGFGLQLVFGARLGSLSIEDDPMDRTVTTTLLGLAFRGHVVPFTEGPVHLGFLFGAGFATNGVTNEFNDPVQEITLSQTAFEIGVRPEWFVTSWLSFHTQVGLTIALHSASDADGNEIGSTTSFGFGHAADFFGNAGFTFWIGGPGGAPAPSTDGGGGDDGDGDGDGDGDDDGWNYGADY